MARFAEFFAGIGLVREAIEPLGWECAFANDISPAKADMYADRFGREHLLVEDIHCVTLADLPADLDLLTASFPCIDLSLAGNRAGLAGKHSGTIWSFLALAKELQQEGTPPRALLLENVTGFLTSNGGHDLRNVCARMGELGYWIDLLVVDASWFTPQSRPRLFVLALRADEVDNPMPPMSQVTRLRNTAVRRFQNRNADLPLVELSMPEPPPRTSCSLASILDDISDNETIWWPQQRVAETVIGMSAIHRKRVKSLLEGDQGGVATMYRRVRNGRTVAEVRSDNIAGCLRTPQGGSSVQFLVDCRSGDTRIRPLTGREYARLQGASEFPINVGRRQAQLGFGDAVCVPAVQWLVHYAFGHMLGNTATASGVQLRLAESTAQYAVGT